jgi:hypothetical protein
VQLVCLEWENNFPRWWTDRQKSDSLQLELGFESSPDSARFSGKSCSLDDAACAEKIRKWDQKAPRLPGGY